MSVRQAVLVLISVVGLSGCAGYTFKSHDYDYVAYHSVAIQSCGSRGLMDVNTAATGNQIIRQRLATADYDRAEFSRTVGKFEKRSFDSEACRNASIAILGWEKQVAQQRQDTKELNEAIRAATPKQTYCNKIGNQVFCNTY